MKRKAFTLIELLVVIAIIALLLSVILPSLGKAKDMAKRVICTSNLRQLQIEWEMYASQNHEKIGAANIGNSVYGWVKSMSVADPFDVQVEAIRKKHLFPYINDTAPYRCPTSKKGETRSYSIVSSMNTNNKTGWKKKESVYYKKTDIKAPASRFVFICEG
ncbi:MAG: type II secretion system protein [Planctomycetota bacterium]